MSQSLTRLCRIQDVKPDQPLRVELGGTAYAVFQVGTEYFVTADLCTHGPGSLSEGFVEGHEIECPFHQGRFDIRTGTPTVAPCTEPLRVWKPVVSGDDLLVDLSPGA